MADETLVYTLLGEARGDGVEGMVAVANVIRNRADSGLFPSNPVDVVLQPWQFSTNNAGDGGNQTATRREVPIGSALYNTAARIVDLYIESETPPTDLTGGSLYYHVAGLDWRYASGVTTAYGTTTIGNHTYYPRRPVPPLNVGEADLLRGYTPTAPVPMPRTSRPGGYTQTTAQKIAALRQETRFQQRQTALASEMKTAMASAAMGSASAGAMSVTGRLPFEGDFTDPNDPILNSITPERARLMSKGVAMDVSSAQARDDVLIGGLGALLGRAFPMGPTAADVTAAPAPRIAPAMTIADVFGNKPAPGLRLPVAPEKRTPLVPIARPGETVGEEALVRQPTKTVVIDPGSGMPAVVEQPGRAARISTAPAWTSMGGSPAMTFPERVLFAQQYAQQTKAAALAAPGAGLTLQQRNAISGSGAPVPSSRSITPPIPMPASARPKVSTLARLPVPEPLSSVIKPRAPSPASAGSSSATVRASAAPAPVAPIISRPATRTVVVHQDGTESVVPRAGSVQMPDGARPSTVAKPSIKPSWVSAPKVSTATVVPQKPAASSGPGLSAPGAGLTAAQKAAISGSGAPVPATKSAAVRAKTSAPAPVVSTKTVTVSKPAAPKASSSSGGGGSSGGTATSRPAAETAKGSATGKSYTVGQKLSNGNGDYVVSGKDSNGIAIFTRL